MSKVKYNYSAGLYKKKKIYLPGPYTAVLILLCIFIPCAVALGGYVGLLGGIITTLAIMSGVAAALGIFPAAFVTIENDESWPWIIEYYTKATKTPPGFDNIYIDNPHYQKVLKEYLAGKDIGSLKPLNDELDLMKRAGAGKDHHLVTDLAEQLKIKREAEEAVKGWTPNV